MMPDFKKFLNALYAALEKIGIVQKKEVKQDKQRIVSHINSLVASNPANEEIIDIGHVDHEHEFVFKHPIDSSDFDEKSANPLTVSEKCDWPRKKKGKKTIFFPMYTTRQLFACECGASKMVTQRVLI